MVSTSGGAASASSGARGYSQKTLIDLESGVGDTVKSLGIVAENVCVAQRGETTAPENRHAVEMQLGHIAEGPEGPGGGCGYRGEGCDLPAGGRAHRAEGPRAHATHAVRRQAGAARRSRRADREAPEEVPSSVDTHMRHEESSEAEQQSFDAMRLAWRSTSTTPRRSRVWPYVGRRIATRGSVHGRRDYTLISRKTMAEEMHIAQCVCARATVCREELRGAMGEMESRAVSPRGPALRCSEPCIPCPGDLRRRETAGEHPWTMTNELHLRSSLAMSCGGEIGCDSLA
mmetsp:Transcript_77073/g.216334  ORF Transcript_77073/g.216334 Transcript_77073/m.216334 type:complete len:288 (+) Transcript_77073:1318-2181(+)